MLIFLGCKNHGISKRLGHSSHEFSRNKLEILQNLPFLQSALGKHVREYIYDSMNITPSLQPAIATI